MIGLLSRTVERLAAAPLLGPLLPTRDGDADRDQGLDDTRPVPGSADPGVRTPAPDRAPARAPPAPAPAPAAGVVEDPTDAEEQDQDQDQGQGLDVVLTPRDAVAPREAAAVAGPEPIADVRAFAGDERELLSTSADVVAARRRSDPEPASAPTPPIETLAERIADLDADAEPVAAEACQSGGVNHTTVDLPWSGDDRAAAKTRIFRYMAEDGRDGAGLPRIVRQVFGADAVAGEADYQLTRRFVENYPDLFEITRRPGWVWVDPTPDLLTLFRRKHQPQTQDSEGGADDTGRGRENWARDRAASLLGRMATVQSDGIRADLLRELATEREAIADTWQIFERIRGEGPEYLGIPYRTRFSDTGRAANSREAFDRAWDRAAERYGDAVMAALTTDPRRHDSTEAATASLAEAKETLLKRLAYNPKEGPPRPGYRPPHLSVLEFTDQGLPHLHVVFFGLNFLTPKDELARIWGSADEADQGEIVWTDHLVNRGGRWRWAGAGPEDADTGTTPREYLSKAMRSLSTVASMTPDEVADAAAARRASDREPVAAADGLWKVALYWGLDQRLLTGSPSLMHADDAEGGREPEHANRPCYRFIGVARYGDLPGYVRNRTLWVGTGPGSGSGSSRPPPPPGETGAAGAGADAD